MLSRGEQFYFDRISQSGGTLYWRLVDPLGRQHFYAGFDDVDVQTLGLAGAYTLIVEGYVGNGTSPINYSFNVQKVTNTSAAITLGTPVNGAVAHVGQQNNYTFSLTSDTQVYFDSLTNTGLTWYLYGPLGNVVSNRSLSGSDGGQFGGGNLLLALVAGDYTLIVDGSGDGTASYSFRLLDLSTATTITPGTPVSANLTPGNETDLYKFNVVAGEQFYFDRISQSGGDDLLAADRSIRPPALLFRVRRS